jgi:hypothetical protein
VEVSLTEQLAFCAYEFTIAEQYLSKRAGVSSKPVAINLCENIRFPHYASTELFAPFGVAKLILPSEEVLSGKKIGRSRPHPDSGYENALRAFRIAKLAGLVIQHRKNKEFDNEFGRMSFEEREIATDYLFFSSFAMTYSGLVFTMNHKLHRAHLNKIIENVRKSASENQGPAKTFSFDEAVYVGADYAAQIFLSGKNSSSRNRNLEKVLAQQDPVALHEFVKRPSENFGHLLYRNNDS